MRQNAVKLFHAFIEFAIFRNLIFLAMALVLYTLAIWLSVEDLLPKVQTVCYKFGHVCAAMHLGYWADRIIFRARIADDSPPEHHIRRAIMVVGIALSASLGL